MKLRHALWGTLLFIQLLMHVLSAGAQQALFEVHDPRTNRTIACKLIKTAWEPGEILIASSKFRALKDQLAKAKQQLKRPGITGQKRKRITVNVRTMTATLTAQRRLCRQEAARLANPTPAPTSIASATPTPVGCTEFCYDTMRTTGCFSIPAPVRGDELSGQQLYATCDGCHSETLRRNRSFTAIRTALLTVPEMVPFGSGYTDQDVADLAAYLNRFNPFQCRTNWP